MFCSHWLKLIGVTRIVRIAGKCARVVAAKRMMMIIFKRIRRRQVEQFELPLSQSPQGPAAEDAVDSLARQLRSCAQSNVGRRGVFDARSPVTRASRETGESRSPVVAQY